MVLLEKQVAKKWLAPLVACLYIVPVLLQMNNLIGFSNIFVWPRQEAYAYFNDSNLDWGQQTKALATTVKERYPNQEIYGNYWWNERGLPYYGLTLKGLDPKKLPHGKVIVITSTELSNADYASFRSVKPDYILTNNTYFYILP
jgi:hypothetical protein